MRLHFSSLIFIPLIFLTGLAIAQSPMIGDHSLKFYYLDSNDFHEISTDSLETESAGSTILVGLGRGTFWDFNLLPGPWDNYGNGSFSQLGESHTYTNWPNSGTALYALNSTLGGSGHVVSAATQPGNEITLAAVEIINGGHIQDFKWNEVLAGNPIKSEPVTTTGPATLVAFWWGDAYAGAPYTARPNNGFSVIDSVFVTGWIVQCAVATKEVHQPGTYDVTWTSEPDQGAQLWLTAIQSPPTSPVISPLYSNVLHQNHPNPFNPNTMIRYDIGAPDFVTINIYSINGKLIKNLVSEEKETGSFYVIWDGKSNKNQNVPAGVYFYRLKTGNAIDTKKMILIK